MLSVPDPFMYVRWVISIALLYGVYTEAGIWTVIAIGLIYIGSEVELHVGKQT